MGRSEDRTTTHVFTIIVLTVAGCALILESLILDWEFWVPPLLWLGILAMWVLHLTQRSTDRFREDFYLGFAVAASFFHGVHATSFFDIAVILGVMLAIFSRMDRVLLLHLILTEYLGLAMVQALLVVKSPASDFTLALTARLCLHGASVVAIYLLCRRAIRNRLAMKETLREREWELAVAGNDMEDFLSNISHELRTPVNVVSGMTSLLLKNEPREELRVIQGAGERLSRQIEDIQDYTEIRSGGVRLELEDYSITSLLNDVLAEYRLRNGRENLELIADLGPSVPAVLKGDVRKLRKILRHLLSNAVKFTKQGGIYIRVVAVPREYGVNLLVEVTDTGIGMSREELQRASEGLYQADRTRDRSTGGIGLGLPVVYGFAHKMNGFVRIESEKGKGTSVIVSLPQEAVDRTPCLTIDPSAAGSVLFHVWPEKYRDPRVRDHYRALAVHIAEGLKLDLYSATTVPEVERLMERTRVTHIFMGAEEYAADPPFFDRLAASGVTVAVSAPAGFPVTEGSRVIVMPKPLDSLSVVRVLNGETEEAKLPARDKGRRLLLPGVRALVVDDEPMNLLVATGLFQDYQIRTDTAGSGREAIEKCQAKEYDIVFMDHMMPEMDGVEAMRQIRQKLGESGTELRIVALTANAVSGARAMFRREGFDGFLAKPIDLEEFERVMKKMLPSSKMRYVERGEG